MTFELQGSVSYFMQWQKKKSIIGGEIED